MVQPMAPRHHVLLIPGFFAFANLGDLRYFLGVRETLQSKLWDLGIDAHVTEIETLPTASIRHRAAKVLEIIENIARDSDTPIHLIGHSTGGLDARLAVTPTASLPTPYDTHDAYRRVRSLVTVAAPHLGTPLASIYGSAMGKPLLQILALATGYVLRYGRLPLRYVLKLGGLFTRVDDIFGLRRTVVDQLYNELLADFNDERRDAVIDFLSQVRDDQSLVFQLTPAALDLFNATTADPGQLRYGCVTTRAKRPRFGSILGLGADPYAQSMYVVYCGLWLLASRIRPELLQELTPAQERALVEQLGAVPSAKDNDGIVPTRSQVWGELIHAASADHLDVVGHYGQTRKVDGIYADWIPTLSGFDDNAFDALWSDVARFIAAA